jgi:predicted ribosome quality control (RQC) complex YloA/Tae2 family protein
MKTVVKTLPCSKREITFLIGQNAYENTDMIDKYGSDTDLWFHSYDGSSCHVIAKMPSFSETTCTAKEKKQIIKYGAFLCKYNTNKLRGEDEVLIRYTRLKNIDTLSSPGMVQANDTHSIFI